ALAVGWRSGYAHACRACLRGFKSLSHLPSLYLPFGVHFSNIILNGSLIRSFEIDRADQSLVLTSYFESHPFEEYSSRAVPNSNYQAIGVCAVYFPFDCYASISL